MLCVCVIYEDGHSNYFCHVSAQNLHALISHVIILSTHKRALLLIYLVWIKNFPQEQRNVDLLVKHQQDERTHGVEIGEGARVRDAATSRSFHTFLRQGEERAVPSFTQRHGAAMVNHSTQVRVRK